MKYMTSNEIRNTFLEYFQNHGHTLIASASLLVLNDPTLLWNNAGVTPLKKYFDGTMIPTNRRLTSCQKCIRTNDIESVGDNIHHTFFEMLGNFSIGDYFKDEAIEMAYEILFSEKYFNFSKDKIYITVYTEDDDAYSKWISLGIDESHIIKLKSNFWEIGEGPCGPDSEIFFDRGEKYDPDNLGIKLIENDIDNSRYVEIWNNVFSQFNSKEGLKRDEYPELPSKNIDTGMGLERMTCIIQEVESAYDTDLFDEIICRIEKLSNKKYNNSKEFRIIADHIRTLTFAIGDGAIFSNEGRGYVIRRLLRRAVRVGRNIGIKDNFMYKIVDSVIDTMKVQYPELEDKKEYIKDIILKEEKLFEKTLESGEKKLNEMLEKCCDKLLPGSEAFKLYDTYGFPFELTLECLTEKGYCVSKEDFDKCMLNQKEMARNARHDEASMNVQNEALLKFTEKSNFVGYDKLENATEVIALIKGDKFVGELSDDGYVILRDTPFYAEKGGQVADTGYIYNDNF
ncbi:MAG TPA: alanine--tRNA ligase, partial [Bacilli bacterium]|nr:alanine--tRNA ligase [Bacilli bacterium]